MGASCTLLREFLFARLVVTEGMLLTLLGITKGMLFVINVGTLLSATTRMLLLTNKKCKTPGLRAERWVSN